MRIGGCLGSSAVPVQMRGKRIRLSKPKFLAHARSPQTGGGTAPPHKVFGNNELVCYMLTQP